MRRYVDWALERPALFKLTFGAWSVASAELDQAATEAHAALTLIVSLAQSAGELPDADPERLTALIRALAHGAADLASTGHLAVDGKGHADAHDLIDDLLAHLQNATNAKHTATDARALATARSRKSQDGGGEPDARPPSCP